MKLNDKAYTILKWISLICIPAAASFYVALSGVWGWPYADEIAKTATALCTLLGALLGISTAEYNRSINEEEYIEDDDDEIWPDEEDDE